MATGPVARPVTAQGSEGSVGGQPEARLISLGKMPEARRARHDRTDGQEPLFVGEPVGVGA